MKHQLKHRYIDAVLFECDVPEEVQASGMAVRYALEKAVKDGAYLGGAYLHVAPYYLTPPETAGLLVGYASLDEGEIFEGIGLLAEVVASVRRV